MKSPYALVALLLVFAFQNLSFAQTQVVFNATQSGWHSPSSFTTSGTTIDLNANDSSTARRGFVMFSNFSLPASATVTSAKLRMFRVSSSAVGTGTVSSHAITAPLTSWFGTSSAMPLGPQTASVATFVGNFDLDVTSVVQAWKTGASPNYGIGIKRLVGTGVLKLASKNDPSLFPQLIVTYTP